MNSRPSAIPCIRRSRCVAPTSTSCRPSRWLSDKFQSQTATKAIECFYAAQMSIPATWISVTRLVPDTAALNEQVQLPADWRVNNFDLIRLLAALQVAVVHAIMYLKPAGFLHLVQFGLNLFPGVPIFFVISGLLISKSYEQSDSIRQYYQNRCLRIFPALWVCLTASLGVICAMGIGFLGTVSTHDWLLWWAAQMSMFQSYGGDFLEPFGGGGLNSSLWTIPVELEFYLFLPALYGLLQLRRRRGHTLVLAVATRGL